MGGHTALLRLRKRKEASVWGPGREAGRESVHIPTQEVNWAGGLGPEGSGEPRKVFHL